LGAVFGPASVNNKGFVGIGLSFFDRGWSIKDVTALALEARLGPGYSHAQLVDLLYTNVVGSAPTPAVASSFVGMLQRGELSAVDLGIVAAETDLNKLNIDLVGLSAHGLPFWPAPGV
jgi:hypothetical protein